MTLLKESAFSLFGKAYQSVLALVFVMFISRFLTENQYGTYRQALLVANTINLILLLGMNETISYNYRIIDTIKRNQLITNMFVIKILVILPAAFILLLSRTSLSNFMNNDLLNDYMPVIAALTMIYAFESLLESYYFGSGQAVLMGKLQVLSYSIHYSFAVIIILLSKSEFYLIVEIALFELIKSVVMLTIILRKETFRFNFNWPYLKELVRFSFPMGVSLILITLNVYVDQMIVSANFSTEDYAIYNNGAMNIPIVQLLTVTVGSIVLPKLAKETTEKSFEDGLLLWRGAATNTALILITFMWLFMIFTKGYVRFVFSERYLDSIPIMRVYLLRYMITFAIYCHLLMVIDKKKYIAVISLLGIVGNIILSLYLIRIFGMIGAAVATVVIQYFVNFMEIFTVTRFTKTKFTDIFEFKRLAKILMTSGSIAAIFALISTLLPLGDILNFFVYGTLYILTTFITYFASGQIDKSLIQVVLKGLSSLKGA
ncbi:oligosaccharide flippase family protein [Acidaminobacter sp.]|uniref:oligosaccharide flippase family protein n=1 Tax=Acidaminobacter sp. TaxID=1872102 RepID=UPI00137FAFFE|nr:oligosaccharide flippase family protein [Acidaminobacter sp.]MDK9710951.1 oligosaccharide flippase family protein [Acidaminobacter sp.]MZQ98591.1 oligosaccharide flippase family protein [Acidaminobacter sp.]